VDIGFVVTSLNSDLNPRRIERYLTTIWDGGARPVVLLTKRDLCPDADPVIREIEMVASGADVLALSAATGEGMEALDPYLHPGQTAALLGSSGAGKSTLINWLFGAQVVHTQPIRDSDGRGRHTTTTRQLWVLPSGALVVDTPGMRELQLWVDAESLDQAFDDLSTLASRCRFTDCRHRAEPGCAVQAALERGTLSEERLAAYDKLRRELEFQARKQDRAKASREKARWKKVSRQTQAHMRDKRGEIY
jgi:ribosome biogenesis GTPase